MTVARERGIDVEKETRRGYERRRAKTRKPSSKVRRSRMRAASLIAPSEPQAQEEAPRGCRRGEPRRTRGAEAPLASRSVAESAAALSRTRWTTFPGRSAAAAALTLARAAQSRPAQTSRSAPRRARERRKPKAERTAQRTRRDARPSTGTGRPARAPAEHEPESRPRFARASSSPTKADKSITVRIDIARRHPTYEKIVRRSRTLHAHDERNEAGEGDVVRVDRDPAAFEDQALASGRRRREGEVGDRA